MKTYNKKLNECGNFAIIPLGLLYNFIDNLFLGGVFYEE